MAKDDQGEKTEEATLRRREEARDEGQVAMSTEFIAASMLVGIAVSMYFGGGMLAEATAANTRGVLEGFGALGREELSVPDGAALLVGNVRSVLPALAMVVLPVIAFGAGLSFWQAGLHFALKAVMPKPSKIDPIKGFGKIFNLRNAVKTGLAALKILTVIAAMGAVAWSELGNLSTFAGGDLGPVMAGAAGVVLRALAAGVLVILVLSLIDLVYQRWQHEKDLRMTKKEVKDEHKNTEGDPHVKARIRRVQRELATQRMMDDVPDATVVVTNPTHFAVALRYERGVPDGAPRVVAKGVDHVAQRIKDLARESGVPLYEDRRLARALHARVQIGDTIPEELFQAVAKVLAYVYRLQGETVSS